MNNNLYNSNDDEHQHVIKLLKELPQEKAPDNFEYNLSVKIKNENFGLNTKESKFFFPWKVLLPASGAVLTTLLLFFIVFGENDSIENPFQIKPKLRTELSNSLLKSSNKVLDEKNSISENDVIIQKKKSNKIINQSSPKVRERVAEAELQKPDFPFDNSTNLDDAIGETKRADISRRASLAGRSNLNSSFDGFYIRNEVDKKYVEALKARIDSLKKEYRNNLNRDNRSK